jgi:hypothetical protein
MSREQFKEVCETNRLTPAVTFHAGGLALSRKGEIYGVDPGGLQPLSLAQSFAFFHASNAPDWAGEEAYGRWIGMVQGALTQAEQR